MSPTPLTPFALENAELMHALHARAGAVTPIAALARDLGRDKDNLRKTRCAWPTTAWSAPPPSSPP